MPEQPEVKGASHIIKRGKGSPYSARTRNPAPCFSLAIHPSVFATGSETRKYCSLTVDRSNFSGRSDLDGEKSQPSANKHDILRAENEPYLYLLNETPKGPLFCETRGKQMVLAAGHHAMVIGFGLEAHITGMRTEIYQKVVANSIPGTNADLRRSNLLRSFVFPEELIVPGSSPRRPRRINVFAAFVSDDWAWVLTDFTRLVRMHVFSRDRPWETTDFEISSPTWPMFFAPLNGGPDWVTERSLAEEALDRWKQSILDRDAQYEKNVAVWKENLKRDAAKARRDAPHSTYTLESHWGAALVKQPKPKKKERPIPVLSNRSIIKHMSSKSSDAFAGYGRHCINDFLYQLAIYPGTPAYVICRNDTLYKEFKQHLHTYMLKYSSKAFLNDAASIPNSDNPFLFNDRSNRIYISKYIDVFRRTTKRVPKEIYNRHLREGLFDPSHTIGLPYAKDVKADLCLRGAKTVDVYFVADVRGYTIIQAMRPRDWEDGEQERVMKDITQCGYCTTIGLTQYHEQVVNRPDLTKTRLSAGRPAKGRKGPAVYKKITRKTLENYKHQIRRARQSIEVTTVADDTVADGVYAGVDVMGDDNDDYEDEDEDEDSRDDFDDPAVDSEDDNPSEYSIEEEDDDDDDDEQFRQLPSHWFDDEDDSEPPLEEEGGENIPEVELGLSDLALITNPEAPGLEDIERVQIERAIPALQSGSRATRQLSPDPVPDPRPPKKRRFIMRSPYDKWNRLPWKVTGRRR